MSDMSHEHAHHMSTSCNPQATPWNGYAQVPKHLHACVHVVHKSIRKNYKIRNYQWPQVCESIKQANTMYGTSPPRSRMCFHSGFVFFGSRHIAFELPLLVANGLHALTTEMETIVRLVCEHARFLAKHALIHIVDGASVIITIIRTLIGVFGQTGMSRGSAHCTFHDKCLEHQQYWSTILCSSWVALNHFKHIMSLLNVTNLNRWFQQWYRMLYLHVKYIRVIATSWFSHSYLIRWRTELQCRWLDPFGTWLFFRDSFRVHVATKTNTHGTKPEMQMRSNVAIPICMLICMNWETRVNTCTLTCISCCVFAHVCSHTHEQFVFAYTS